MYTLLYSMCSMIILNDDWAYLIIIVILRSYCCGLRYHIIKCSPVASFYVIWLFLIMLLILKILVVKNNFFLFYIALVIYIIFLIFIGLYSPYFTHCYWSLYVITSILWMRSVVFVKHLLKCLTAIDIKAYIFSTWNLFFLLTF